MASSSRGPSPLLSASGSPRDGCSSAGPSLWSPIFLYMVVFYRARTALRCAAAGLLRRFHFLRLVALVARRAPGRATVRVVPLPLRAWSSHSSSGVAGQLRAGNARQASSRRVALSRRCAHELQSGRHLVAGAQAHRQLVALDRGGLVYIGEYIYKDLWLTALLYAGLVALAILGLRDWRRAAASDQNRA